MLDIFDYMSSQIDEKSSGLVLLFSDCTIKKDMDFYPVPSLKKGDKIELISVNLDAGIMQFYRQDKATVLKYAEFEISTSLRLVEFT